MAISEDKLGMEASTIRTGVDSIGEPPSFYVILNVPFVP